MFIVDNKVFKLQLLTYVFDVYICQKEKRDYLSLFELKILMKSRNYSARKRNRFKEAEIPRAKLLISATRLNY